MKNSLVTTPTWSVLAIVVWLCGAFFYSYQFVLRIFPGVMSHELMRDFGVQGCALGVLGAFYYNAYSALQVPVGIMLDRFGIRKMMSLSIFLCALGCFVFAKADGLAGASFGRLLMGIGSSCAFIGTVKLITLWFPTNRVAIFVGITMALGTCGATFSNTVLPRFFQGFGWRPSMLALGMVGAFLALCAYTFMKEHVTQAPVEEKKISVFKGLWVAATSPQLWFLALFACFMYVPLAAIADLWGIPFLCKLYNIKTEISGSYISLIYWGVALGGIIISSLSDYTKKRKPYMAFCAVLALFVYSILIFVPISEQWMVILLFIGGMAFGGQLLCFTAVAESMPAWASGVSLGFTNMIIMMSGVIFQPLVGWLLDHLWSGEMVAGVPCFTTQNFRYAFLPIPLCLCMAFLMTFFIKETHPLRQKIMS